MFDEQSLAQLRGVMVEVIREETPKIVRAIVEEELMSFYEHQIMPQFDDIYKRLDGINKELASINNRMATKGFMEERLERFRLDLGLSYRHPGRA